MDELLRQTPGEENDPAGVLEDAWQVALTRRAGRREPAQGLAARVMRSKEKTIHYAAINQALGKLCEPARDVHSVQMKDTSEGRWDARSLCHKVVVPWEARSGGMLGGSPEPYANNPLRVTRLERERSDTRSPTQWRDLYDLLARAQDAASAREVLEQCLDVCVELAEEQQIRYPIRERVSLPDLMDLLRGFMTAKSGGLRGMVVATALLRVVGRHTGLWEEVVSQGVNEADAAKGEAADITCSKGGVPVLYVEVKERMITIQEARQAAEKVRALEGQRADKLWLAVEGAEDTEGGVEEAMAQAWRDGLDMNRASIQQVAREWLLLMPVGARKDMVEAVGGELDRRKVHADRMAWRDMLEG